MIIDIIIRYLGSTFFVNIVIKWNQTNARTNHGRPLSVNNVKVVFPLSIKFTIKGTNEIQKVNMIDKIVEMSKVDIAGEEIEGATIQVLDKDNKVVDEWVSCKEPQNIKNLVDGETYTLHEEIVADSYVKATDVEFIVTTDKETQKLVMIDKLVEITKTDITNGNELEGAELEVTDEDGNTIDKWTSTKEPHKEKGLEEGKTYI